MKRKMQQDMLPLFHSHSRQRTPGGSGLLKPSPLLPGPVVAGYQIRRNEESHAIMIDHLLIRCTAEEYRLLLKLLEDYERPVLLDDLIALFQDASQMDRALLRGAKRKLVCMLSDLRNKLWLTDFTVVQITDVGYMLLPQCKLWSQRHPEFNDRTKHA